MQVLHLVKFSISYSYLFTVSLTSFMISLIHPLAFSSKSSANCGLFFSTATFRKGSRDLTRFSLVPTHCKDANKICSFQIIFHQRTGFLTIIVLNIISQSTVSNLIFTHYLTTEFVIISFYIPSLNSSYNLPLSVYYCL